MSYGDACSHPSGFEQGNIGYSGTPLWKIRQQMAAARQMTAEPSKAKTTEGEVFSTKSPRLVVDAVVLSDEKLQRKMQPMARHVLVKDLHKVSSALKIPIPKEGLFDDGTGLVRCALFALFDG